MQNDDKNQYDFPDENDDPIAENSKSPAVKGEENPYSGDATDSVPVDIDEELKKVGLSNDPNGELKPLDIKNETD